MSEYTLSNSAAVIDSAITRVASADAEPTANSENMVTSKGVKQYVDGKVTTLEGKIDGQYNFTTENSQAAGYQVFESGLKMAWGYCNAPADTVFDFPAGVNFTVAPTMQLTYNNSTTRVLYGAHVNNVTTTGFNYDGTYNSNYGPRYLAIGH